MLRPIDTVRRDGPLYPGSTKTLRDFIDPKHLLLRIDANFDFQSLVECLLDKYDPDIGRPAIHPEIVIRALILSAVYDLPSYRQLCERISENLAWRWFCYLTLEDQVFDHSSISVFIDRIGSDGFEDLLSKLNDELLRLGLLSPRTYADSSLVEANVSKKPLVSTGYTPEEFAERAEKKDGIYTVCEKQPAVPEENRLASFAYLKYQDAKGQMLLSRVDPDARWRKPKRNTPAIIGYKDNIIVDKSGFILARSLTPADASDPAGIEPLLDHLPLSPTSMCADTGYRSGRFRYELRQRGIAPFIPLHPVQQATSISAVSGKFAYHGDHLTCRQGKTLKQIGFPDAEGHVAYRASKTDCQACPISKSCLTDKEKYKNVNVSRYEYEFRRAERVTRTVRYQREMHRRQIVVEGVFAHLDRLAWDRARLRGQEKVDCQAFIAAIAHNLLKALTKRRFWKRGACAKEMTHQANTLSHLLSLIVSLLRTQYCYC